MWLGSAISAQVSWIIGIEGAGRMESDIARAIAESLVEKVGDVDHAISYHLDRSLEAVKKLFHEKFLDFTEKTTGVLSTLKHQISFAVFDLEAARILYANETACGFFGLPLEEIIGDSILRFCRPGIEGNTEELAQALDFLFQNGYWFGPGFCLSVRDTRTDVIGATFFIEDTDGILRGATLGLPADNLRTFSDRNLAVLKKRYLDMAVGRHLGGSTVEK